MKLYYLQLYRMQLYFMQLYHMQLYYIQLYYMLCWPEIHVLEHADIEEGVSESMLCERLAC